MTLVELLIAISVLTIAVAAIFVAQLGQVALSDHARNLSVAIGDANRVLEEIRRQNAKCGSPSAAPPPSATRPSWDDWLADTGASGGGGKNLPPSLNERVIVTCRSQDNTAFCVKSQVGNPSSSEWHYALSPLSGAPSDPMRVTVAVCWSDRGRIFGECKWSAGNAPPLVPDDNLAYPGGSDTPNVIDSLAMSTTLVTCWASP